MLPTHFVTLAALTLSPAPPAAAPSAPAAVAPPAPPRRRSEAAIRPEELYSLRARRRFASYLRLRLLELRSEGLEHAADVIERRLPVDSLFKARAPGPIVEPSP